MATHPKDRDSDNPRMQCVVCRRWMRLTGRRLRVTESEVTEVEHTRFYGGCEYAPNNGEHLAGKGGDNDVCEVCCNIECKRLAAERLPSGEQK